jgi:hypothetical protein
MLEVGCPEVHAPGIVFLSRFTFPLLLLALPAPGLAQPTTQPTTQPTLAATQPTTQPAPDAVPWTPQTVLKAGGRYVLPRGVGVAIQVTVPDVTFYGGWVWPQAGSGIYFKPGVNNGRVIGTRFDFPNAPAGAVKIPDVGTCVLTYAKATEVRGCVFGSVNECVRAMPGSEDLKVVGCFDEKRDIRSAWVYLAGVRRALIVGNSFWDSATENGIRTSPQQMPDGTVAVSENVIIRDNDLSNPGTKNAIDARHVRGIKIEHNRLFQARGSAGDLIPALRLGDSMQPGCTGAFVHDNDVFTGSIHAKAVSQGVCDGNRIHGANPATDVPINFDSQSHVLPTYTSAFYTPPLPNKVKPVSTVGGVGNAWVSTATTQPAH